MAMNQELWTKDFAANLYDTKDWFRFAKNWSSHVNGGIVHIPQAVAPAIVQANPAFPVATAAATYTDLTFTNSMLVANPRYVSNIDAAEASFDTRSAIMGDVVGQLQQAISIEIAEGWKPAQTATGSIIRTSGAGTRTNIYGKAVMKSLTLADILGARAALIRQGKNANLNNLFLIVDPIFYNDLLQTAEFVNADSLVIQTAVKGFVGEIAGMKVIQRSLGMPYVDNVTVPNDVAAIEYDDSYANTHFSSALLVDGDKVGYALGTMENGEIQMGVESYATGYYSDVLQGHTRAGSSALYAEDANNVVTGVVAIVEEA